MMQAVVCRSNDAVIFLRRHQRTTRKNKRSLTPVAVLLILLTPHPLNAWSNSAPPCSRLRTRTRTTATDLSAKRNKRSSQQDDDLNRWYDSVDDNASPDDVFWAEMERQRLLSQVGGSSSTTGTSSSESTRSPMEELAARTSSSASNNPSRGRFSSSAMSTASAPGSSSMMGSMDASGAGASPLASMSTSSSPLSGAQQQQQPQPPSPKNVEATLSEYEAHAVQDNWLNEELAAMMMDHDDFFSTADSVKSLDQQLEEWEAEEDDNGEADMMMSDDENTWMQSDEPWDHWGTEKGQGEEQSKQDDTNRVRVDPNNNAAEFLFHDEETEQEKLQTEKEEAAYLERLSKLTMYSRRLERARDNPKAAAFFAREPDEVEGYDRLWVAAIDNVCFKNLVGVFRNYGVQFADNFGDFQDGSAVEDRFCSVEDAASFKARRVFEVTGLPCIASRTSFEVEPIPDLNPGSAAGRSSMATTNPRVASGYRFNDIGLHVDYICDALRTLSEPDRVTQFKTCLCYYDGEMEIFDYGVCDVDLIFANSMRTFIPVAQSINEMVKTLQFTFGLEYQKWIKRRRDESSRGFGGASLKLRDRVLKEGRVLPNDIVDVSAFMDAKVDVNLMDDCAKELSDRFMNQKPNKILTVATTGLVIALPMAKYLQVPVVYARKERSVVMAETFQASYSSKTVGKNRILLVAQSHLDEDDRVLIIDDFLSSGASQEALLRIISDAGATAVGVGVLLEKVYDSGRQSLSGFDVPIHSLCRIASVKDGVIQLLEEEGFDGL